MGAYQKFSDAHAKKSPIVKNCVWAFITGGAICTLGQVLLSLYSMYTDEKSAATLVSVTLILLASLTTGLGIFDKLAHHAGAGTLVPITGFSNAVASCAIDSKSEGLVLGLGAKIFAIAGPVILYGVVASVIYGVIYWIMKMCGVM
jgi:stage V sporulation protein AC